METATITIKYTIGPHEVTSNEEIKVHSVQVNGKEVPAGQQPGYVAAQCTYWPIVETYNQLLELVLDEQ